MSDQPEMSRRQRILVQKARVAGRKGRPILEEEEYRGKFLTVRMTEPQYDQLIAAAQYRGLSVSAFSREELLRAAKRVSLFGSSSLLERVRERRRRAREIESEARETTRREADPLIGPPELPHPSDPQSSDEPNRP